MYIPTNGTKCILNIFCQYTEQGSSFFSEKPSISLEHGPGTAYIFQLEKS